MVSVPAAPVAGTFFFARSRRAAKFLEPAKKHEFSRMIQPRRRIRTSEKICFICGKNKPQKTLRFCVFARDSAPVRKRIFSGGFFEERRHPGK